MYIYLYNIYIHIHIYLYNVNICLYMYIYIISCIALKSQQREFKSQSNPQNVSIYRHKAIKKKSKTTTILQMHPLLLEM